MATELNVPEEEVIKIAEKAIKEVDLEKISVQSFADFTKSVREKVYLIKASDNVTKLSSATSISELLKLSKELKVSEASSDTVHVLAGSANDARKVFDSQTIGWTTKFEGDGILTKTSQDGKFELTNRVKSTASAKEPFNTINGTIDVQEFTVYSNGVRDKLGNMYEIKFAN